VPQAHPARANVRRGKADEPLTGGYHPYRHGPVHYLPAPDTRTPQADRALPLPAKPARQRPADRAGDRDRPARYPGGTWHPPPVDLRRHRASPATTPTHPILPNSGRRPDACLCTGRDIYSRFGRQPRFLDGHRAVFPILWQEIRSAEYERGTCGLDASVAAHRSTGLARGVLGCPTGLSAWARRRPVNQLGNVLRLTGQSVKSGCGWQAVDGG
jgi:hypothetical protein